MHKVAQSCTCFVFSRVTLSGNLGQIWGQAKKEVGLRRVKMLEMFMAQRRRAESLCEFVTTLLWMAITPSQLHLGGQPHCQSSLSLLLLSHAIRHKATSLKCSLDFRMSLSMCPVHLCLFGDKWLNIWGNPGNIYLHIWINEAMKRKMILKWLLTHFDH